MDDEIGARLDSLTSLIACSSHIRGPGGAAKSCDALLTRVEKNAPTLEELVILSSKTFGAVEVERLAAALGKSAWHVC